MAGRDEKRHEVATVLPEEEDPLGHPALRDYTVVCLVGLLVVAVILIQEGLGWYGLLPVLVGAVSLLARWSIGPPLVLFLVGGFYFSSVRFHRSLVGRFDESSLLTSLVLAMALVVYVAGSYRLQSLTLHILPPDPVPWGARRTGWFGKGRGKAPRWTRQWMIPASTRERAPGAVHRGEIPGMVLMGVMLALLATLAWTTLLGSVSENILGLPEVFGHALVLTWILGVGLALIGATLGYLRARQASGEEARLYLQDQLWRQTRAEQGANQRWWVWGWLATQPRGRT
jgi:hypothetical protein